MPPTLCLEEVEKPLFARSPRTEPPVLLSALAEQARTNQGSMGMNSDRKQGKGLLLYQPQAQEPQHHESWGYLTPRGRSPPAPEAIAPAALQQQGDLGYLVIAVHGG